MFVFLIHRRIKQKIMIDSLVLENTIRWQTPLAGKHYSNSNVVKQRAAAVAAVMNEEAVAVVAIITMLLCTSCQRHPAGGVDVLKPTGNRGCAYVELRHQRHRG